MIDNMECPVCPELARDCRNLLNSGLVGIAFDILLCRISCRHHDCISDYRWRPEPSKPYEFEKYLTLSPKDKNIYRDQHPIFLIQGRVAQYLDDRDRISNQNQRNLQLLKSWLNLPKITQDQDGITQEESTLILSILKTYQDPRI